MLWPLGPIKWSDLKLEATEAVIDSAIEEARQLAGEIATCKEEAVTKANGALAKLKVGIDVKK